MKKPEQGITMGLYREGKKTEAYKAIHRGRGLLANIWAQESRGFKWVSFDETVNATNEILEDFKRQIEIIKGGNSDESGDYK